MQVCCFLKFLWHDLIIAQKEHKAYQRGEVQKEIAELPRHKIIVLDGEGIPAIGRVERTPFRTPSPRQVNSRKPTGTYRSGFATQRQVLFETSSNLLRARTQARTDRP
jgi:hypothetical protein